MDRNTVIAFILIGLIFLLWMSPWYRENVVGVQPLPADSTAVQEMAPDTTALSAGTQKPSRIQPSRAPDSKPVTAIQIDTIKDTVITLKNKLVELQLSSKGGGTLTSWKLIDKNVDDKTKYRYRISIQDNSPVEMIPENAEGNLAVTTDRGFQFGQIPFQVTEDSYIDDIRTIKFSRTLENGAVLEKTFILHPDANHLNMKIRMAGFQWDQIGEKYMLEWNSGLKPTEPNLKDDLMYYEAIALQGDDLTKQKKKGGTEFRDGDTHWTAVRTKYFLMAIIPEETGIGAELFVEEQDDWKTMRADLAMPWHGYPEETQSFKVFLGPIDYHLLKSYNAGLEKSMSWGMKIIKPFSIGALYALQYLYGKLHNYGWAIILFAILIKIVLYPLTRHSYKSMHAMQALQPEMNKIREQYKSNPQKMNEKTMELYKKHGVNPMGGCLPMLLQMPVLFALFNLFRSTIMLRHAEFLMIKDLSAPDHILGSVNLLPLIMGGAMIIQQRLSSAQNSQQKAMTFMMPIFLTFIFYRFSSGLNLYYLIFNIFTIAQELFIKRGDDVKKALKILPGLIFSPAQVQKLIAKKPSEEDSENT